MSIIKLFLCLPFPSQEGMLWSNDFGFKKGLSDIYLTNTFHGGQASELNGSEQEKKQCPTYSEFWEFRCQAFDIQISTQRRFS